MKQVDRTGEVRCLGGCHCGAVRFEIEVPQRVRVNHCNCSMCNKLGFQHLILNREQFRLLSGEEHLSEYRFHTHTARHLFCRICGIKSFYVPRSHPGGISVNFRCLDDGSLLEVEWADFDGRNWSRSRQNLTTDPESA